MSLELYIILAIIILAIALYFSLFRKYVKAAPNEVLIVSGGKKSTITLPDGIKKEIGYRFQIGGGTYIYPFIEKVERLPIEVITIHIKTPEVLTSEGIPILADASAQVRIDTVDEYQLYLGIENFIGRGNEGIHEVAQTVLEGKVREVIGSMKVNEIYQGRHIFNKSVLEDAGKDLRRMGLAIISFALKDISDTQGYLESLSKPMIAAAKQTAAIAQAEADKEAVIKSAEAKKEADIARLKADAAVAGRAWENETLKAQSQIEVNKKKAQADVSYDLERNKLAQELKREEYKVKIIETQEQAKVQQEEIVRKEKELEATVIKPAEARKYQVQVEAEAESFRTAKEAEGRSEAKRKENEIEAERILKLGEAEAQAMALKAKSYELYNHAAMYQMIIDKLPELAKSVSEPLSRIDKIVMLSGDGNLDTSKITGQVAHTLAQLPEVIKSLTGIDLAKYFREKLGSDTE